MRYMRWSYPDLLACPEAYLVVIAELSRQEAAAAERRRRHG